jgi:hypothetical protein
MIFTATQLDGAWLIDIEPREDERGFFSRIWCRQELTAQGLDTELAQEACPLIGTAARCADCIFSDPRMQRPRSCDARAVRSSM